ncbi:hypothetical protein A0H81_07939 [Grifola frondosa]|uniref:DH domain-containing protein n=1 Tax=Grifola frondosa TaxID=5627 RepID=A0A1C7M6N8_GRIFR|nr:hypothetical protein A0H81_07939 [Grifola frondosa]
MLWLATSLEITGILLSVIVLLTEISGCGSTETLSASALLKVYRISLNFSGGTTSSNLPPSSRAFASPLSPPLNLWADRRHSAYTAPAPDTSYPRISLDVPSRPPSRATSAYEAETSHITFPEPQLQLHRSSSQRSSYRPSSSVTLGHRSTRSDLVLSPSTLTAPTIPTGESRPPSFESTPELVPKELSDELSNLTKGCIDFKLANPESSEEWHLLVPPEALDVLDKTEIKRQSVLFEIIKSERDYVSDLELLKEVFIDPLINTSAVPKERVRLFVQEVFHNLDHILDTINACSLHYSTDNANSTRLSRASLILS